MKAPIVIVVGGGHAGAEAALAAVRAGASAVLVTFDIGRIGEMSCNPAIGGVAKGTLVREIDALGGAMGECADGSALQFRMLNRSRGPAVWGPRVQSDAALYSKLVRKSLEEAGVILVEDEVTALSGPTERLSGVRLSGGRLLAGDAVVIAAGTFLRGVLFRGRQKWRGGRTGDGSSFALADDLERRGFALGRFKTGTPPRLAGTSLDYSEMELQCEDGPGFLFSFRGRRFGAPSARMPCWVTRTTGKTRRAAMSAFGESPLFTGGITGRGPRYCPSFEDKVVRFPERSEHVVFVEPVGIDSPLVYLNGLSTSLPEQAQIEMIRSLPGCSEARVARWGYAVEYGYFLPGGFDGTLRAAGSENLFFAGQICGTTGYEEAAALGLLAGRNAAAAALGKPLFEPDQAWGYIGVLVSDVTCRGLDEPYRLFSSRAWSRLHLREDNAPLRCLPWALEMGVARPGDADLLAVLEQDADKARSALESCSAEGVRALDLCRRPEIDERDLVERYPELAELDRESFRSAVLDEKYRGYVDRAARRMETWRRLHGLSLNSIGDFRSVEEISWEAREALERARPSNLGEASALPGVRPSDIDGLLVHLARTGGVPRGTHGS
ncbi:tRNA uridine-5-carboxymethylaminomethyl(34) synthesis enzyme MnmG [Candidatus Fermentibacteria bacterium]|nr:tRNA uridine-5-carboxymethylaminomethyl(34) synthesis enzyme MnmG [Candidatus Fermentibacteria bacterium]